MLAPAARELLEQRVALAPSRAGRRHAERTLELELLVEVHGVGGEHTRPPAARRTSTCWPGEWPPTVIARSPGASSCCSPIAVTRPSRQAPTIYATASGSTCAQNCRLRATGADQNSSSAAGTNSSAAAKVLDVADVVPVQVRDQQTRDARRIDAEAARAPAPGQSGTRARAAPPPPGESRCRRR